MNFITLKENAIKNQLPGLDLETKLNIYNELNLTDYEQYYNDFDELMNLNFDNPADAARTAYYGNFNMTDEYFTLDVYGNIKGYNEYTLNDELTDILQDHLEDIYSLDDYILTYFDLDEINAIEEETEEISARAADYWTLRKDKQQLFNEYNNIYKDLDISEILKNDPDLMESAIYEELNNHEYITLFDPQTTIETVYNELGLTPDDKTAAAAMKKATSLIERQRYYNF